MPAPRNRKHLFVQTGLESDRYRPHRKRIDQSSGPLAPASRPKHAKALERALNAAVIEARKRRDDAGIQVHGAKPGLYIHFESQPGVPLELGSLEARHLGIELVAVITR